MQTLQQLSGFIDLDKINPDAWPALLADLSAGENGIISLAFGAFHFCPFTCGWVHVHEVESHPKYISDAYNFINHLYLKI